MTNKRVNQTWSYPSVEIAKEAIRATFNTEVREKFSDSLLGQKKSAIFNSMLDAAVRSVPENEREKFLMRVEKDLAERGTAGAENFLSHVSRSIHRDAFVSKVEDLSEFSLR